MSFVGSLLDWVILKPVWFCALAMCYTCSVIIYIFVCFIGLFGVQVECDTLINEDMLAELSKNVCVWCFTAIYNVTMTLFSIAIVSYNANTFYLVMVSNYVLAKAYFKYSIRRELHACYLSLRRANTGQNEIRNELEKCRNKLKKCRG